MLLSNYWLFLCLSWSNQVNVHLKTSCFCLSCSGIGERGYVLAIGFSCTLARKRYTLGCWTSSDPSDSNSEGQWLCCYYGKEAVKPFPNRLFLSGLFYGDSSGMMRKSAYIINDHCTPSSVSLEVTVGNPSWKSYSTAQSFSLLESMVN